MKKINLLNIIYIIIYLCLTGIVIFTICFKTNYNDKHKIKKSLIKYTVLDVIKHKQFEDGTSSTSFKVQIDDHQYLMIINTAYANIIFKHLDNCSYCKQQNLIEYNHFSFSTLDGFNTNLQNKLTLIKQNQGVINDGCQKNN